MTIAEERKEMMANQLFNQLQQNPILQQFQTFQNNPLQFLTQHKINIPQEYVNDPHAAVQYLMNNGQMSQAQFDRISKIAQNMGVKL